MQYQYKVGQVGVTTLTCENVTIIRCFEFGTSNFYICIITGRGTETIHETKLMTKTGGN